MFPKKIRTYVTGKDVSVYSPAGVFLGVGKASFTPSGEIRTMAERAGRMYRALIEPEEVGSIVVVKNGEVVKTIRPAGKYASNFGGK